MSELYLIPKLYILNYSDKFKIKKSQMIRYKLMYIYAYNNSHAYS